MIIDLHLEMRRDLVFHLLFEFAFQKQTAQFREQDS
jgi:hypothetical protein